MVHFGVVFSQLLACVNADVTFKSKGEGGSRHRGVAVALKWLFSLVRKYGGTPPPEERVRQEIKTLSLGDVSDKKQFFSKHPNGNKISRATGHGVEVTQISCVTVKRATFPSESWKVFAEGAHVIFIFRIILHLYNAAK